MPRLVVSYSDSYPASDMKLYLNLPVSIADRGFSKYVLCSLHDLNFE